MTVQVGMIILAVVMFSGVSAAADIGGSIPYDTITSIADLVIALIIALAVVNGALGILQYMTAGSNVERSSAGKERLYKTAAALIGAAIIKGLVTALGTAVANGSEGVDNPLDGG